MRNQSKVMNAVASFIALFENQIHTKVQNFHSDNAREYVSHHVEEYFRKKIIIYETSCSYPPPYSGVAKKKIAVIRRSLELLCFRQLPKRS